MAKNNSVVRYDRLPPEWKMANVGLNALRTAQTAITNIGVHGIYAGIPIMCKGRQCPFIDTCAMEALHIDVSTLAEARQRCPIEIAEIMSLYGKYTQQFGIDSTCEDMVMMGLVKELIDYDIQIRRADHKMASQADFLEDIVVGVSDNGHPIVNKEIAKPVEYKERALRKKHEILQLLNSTPKDKAGTKLNINMDPSTYAASLLSKARELGLVIDIASDAIEPVEEGDENGQ